jgi:phosphatidylinositol-3-phosphatase
VKALARPFRRAMAAAATLTGRRFGLLVASSLVATSAIVAAAMTSSHDIGPLAGLLSRSLAADATPAQTAAAPTPEPAASSAGHAAQPAPSPTPSSSVEELPAPEPLSAPAAIPASEPEAPPPTAPETPAPEAGRIKHVFVISLASPGYEAAFGSASQMPYLATTLRPKGDLLSNYSLLSEAALPNSLAAVSGQPPNAQTRADCPTYTELPSTAAVSSKGVVAGSGCVYPVETQTIAGQLGTALFSWRAYMEDMADETGKPATCVHPEPDAADEPALGGYASRLNPFVFFHSLLDLGECSADDVPLTELEKDLKKTESTPNYSYIAPNLCNSGVAGQCPAGAPEGAASADAFLAQLVPKILASPAYKKDGLLIVTFGQVSPPSPTAPAATLAPEPLKVGTLLISPFVSAGATDGAAYDPYSLLRSNDELFGLTPLAGATGTKVKSFAPALLGEDGGD